ncbi:MAG TPA: class I SAM-dependent methyltransferase [Spirochaetota bacterium]
MSDNTTPHQSSAYDEQVRRTIPFYETFHDETISMVRAIRSETNNWLDTGCGTGTFIVKAIHFFPDTKFYLADPSPEMCSRASAKLSLVPASRVSVLPPCPSEHLRSVLPECVDVISAIQSHHYLSAEERARATRSCYDSLSSDGVYLTFENIRPRSERGIDVAKERWKAFQLSQGKTDAVVAAHLDRFNSEYFPITLDEHISLLKKTGFRTIELFWYSVMQAGLYAIK